MSGVRKRAVETEKRANIEGDVKRDEKGILAARSRTRLASNVRVVDRTIRASIRKP